MAVLALLRCEKTKPIQSQFKANFALSQLPKEQKWKKIQNIYIFFFTSWIIVL
jgi:hypothetical protein